MIKQLIQIENDRIVRQIPLKKRRYTLGRGAENDIVFDSGKVSRLHATLIAEGDTYSIVDQGARNRVFVNDEQVKRRRLASGDKINLSRGIALLYLSESETDDKITHTLNRIWEVVHKKDFLRLKEVTNRIISLDNLDNILEVVLAEVIELVNAERGFIALTTEAGEIRMDTGISHNIPLHEDSVRKSVFSHSIVRRAIENRENIFLLNTEDDEEYLSNSVLELDLRSIMCAPLCFGDKPVGVLYVDAGYQLSDFDEMDQFFFTILADHAAIAIENAKLYSRVQMSNQQLKAEIRESETRYRQLVELSPEAIAVHSEGKIVFVNPAAVNLMGAQKPEDLIGLPALEIVHPDHRDMVKERIRRELAEGQPTTLMEEKFLRFDGSAVEVEVVGVPLTYRGKPAVQIIARDITERKRLEQELLRAQKLESVGVLAGGIAHDFNNTLQVIKGNTLLAIDNIADRQNVELCLTAIEKAVSNATNLTAQLLTFSKGGTPITRATSIEALIEESVIFALRGSNVAYILDFAENLRFVEADSGQINQVIHNLVLNAVQAMSQGGVITISASNIKVTKAESIPGLKEGSFVKISIRDQGVGIAEADLSRVFDPYFTTKQTGSGLGLASCYSIITKHGGIIEAESEVGQGATFTFYLPTSSKSLEKIEREKPVTKLKAKVLVLDDDKMVREVGRRMLQRLGCRAECVADGVEAIEQFVKSKEAGDPFDVVIFDLTVPGGMGGKETIEKLRRHTSDVKAIVVSGYSHDPVMAAPEKYGFQDVISKPFNQADLAKTIQKVLRNE